MTDQMRSKGPMCQLHRGSFGLPQRSAKEEQTTKGISVKPFQCLGLMSEAHTRQAYLTFLKDLRHLSDRLLLYRFPKALSQSTKARLMMHQPVRHLKRRSLQTKIAMLLTPDNMACKTLTIAPRTSRRERWKMASHSKHPRVRDFFEENLSQIHRSGQPDLQFWRRQLNSSSAFPLPRTLSLPPTSLGCPE